jgi:hypothetical protein
MAKAIETGTPVWWADVARIQEPHEGETNIL